MKHQRSFTVVPFEDVEVRASGAGDDYVTLVGYASVFNRRSHNLLGWGPEVILPGAFKRVLDDENLHCHLVVGHDMNKPIASTRSTDAKLELREDPKGLRVYARIKATTTHAKDAIEDVRLGLMSQMSFAFTLGEGDYTMVPEDDGEIVSYVNNVRELFDVSICAQGAYPQTEIAARAQALTLDGLTPEVTALARAIAALVASGDTQLPATEADRRAATPPAEDEQQSPDPAAQDEPADEDTEVPADAVQDDPADVEEGAVAPDVDAPTEEQDDAARRARALAIARARLALAEAVTTTPGDPSHEDQAAA